MPQPDFQLADDGLHGPGASSLSDLCYGQSLPRGELILRLFATSCIYCGYVEPNRPFRLCHEVSRVRASGATVSTSMHFSEMHVACNRRYSTLTILIVVSQSRHPHSILITVSAPVFCRRAGINFTIKELGSLLLEARTTVQYFFRLLFSAGHGPCRFPPRRYGAWQKRLNRIGMRRDSAVLRYSYQGARAFWPTGAL